MGLYRDETGMLIEVDDRFAQARGYTPAETIERGAELRAAVAAERADQRGIIGDINAGLTGIASGATLGLSDVALANSLTPLERQRLQEDLEAHPNLRMGGEIVGAVAGGLASPGSVLARTPAGYLGQAAARSVEAGLEQGGLRGTARALNAMGVEGAVQNAGQYIGHSAIEDKETTAEGLAGSLGTGYAFGAAGGGAALGVVKGAMAARRLYSRVMDGRKAAETAASSWTLASQEALDADTATLRAAETKLEQIRTAKMEAQRGRNESRAAMREEQMRASEAAPRVTEDGTIVAPEASVGPEPLIDVQPQSGPGGVTTAYQKPNIEFDPAAAQAFDETMPSMRDQVNEVASKIEPVDKGAKTGAFKRSEGGTKKMQRAAADEPADTELEAQLKGTKNALDEGRPLRDVNAMKADRQVALSEIRYKATEDLLGPETAKLEKELQDIVDEFAAARSDLGTLSDGVPEALDGGEISRAVNGEAPPRPNQTARASPRGRQARQILDDAHEEALLRAKYGANPQEAGRALTEAEELERLLAQVDDVSDGVPRTVDGSPEEMFFDQMANDIRKIHRYEEASAKLADNIGEAAHPTSLMKAKALRDAAKESERKVMDRVARAVDDAEHFGPEYKTPKERVAYSRERLNEAQKNVEELGLQEKEARDAFQRAGKKVREGEKLKNAADRANTASAAKAGKLGAADVGGIWEIVNLPGLPKPSDLPVVGPLLGAYLKFRTLKRAMGKMMGRVPATADAQAAARAAQTRDRIARAVDRSLGLVERTGKFAARRMPAASVLLSRRIFDDGGEDPGPKAPITKQATARMRELSAYVHTPNAIEIDVRRQLQGVADPDLIAAAEKHRRFMMEYILKHAPKVPDQGILKTHDWEMSAGQAMSLARRMEAADDPPAVFEKMAQDRDLVSLEASETVRDVYPRLFQEALQRALTRAAESPGKIPYRTRVNMSVFYKMPFEPALEPENFAITQSVYDRKPATPMPTPPGGAPPAPSVAQPTDLAQQYMPSFDRR